MGTTALSLHKPFWTSNDSSVLHLKTPVQAYGYLQKPAARNTYMCACVYYMITCACVCICAQGLSFWAFWGWQQVTLHQYISNVILYATIKLPLTSQRISSDKSALLVSLIRLLWRRLYSLFKLELLSQVFVKMCVTSVLGLHLFSYDQPYGLKNPTKQLIHLHIHP